MGKGNEMWAAIAKPFAVRWAAGRLSGSTPKKPRPEMQAKAKPSWSRQLSDLKASASEVARPPRPVRLRCALQTACQGYLSAPGAPKSSLDTRIWQQIASASKNCLYPHVQKQQAWVGQSSHYVVHGVLRMRDAATLP
jgi:hypothetical protein